MEKQCLLFDNLRLKKQNFPKALLFTIATCLHDVDFIQINVVHCTYYQQYLIYTYMNNVL